MPFRTSIYIISLAGAEERRAEFASNAVTDLPWQFHDAHTTLTTDLRYDPQQALIRGGRKLTRAEIGCYTSHYSLWRQLLNDELADRYLIFEDDVIIDWKFIQQFVALTEAEIGANFLRLFYMKAVPARKVFGPFLEVHQIVELRQPGFGHQAYLIDKVAAAKLVPSLCNILEPVDVAVESGWRHGVRNLSVFPFPVIHKLGRSQIGPNRWDAAPKPLWMKIVRGLIRGHNQIRKTIWDLRNSKRAS